MIRPSPSFVFQSALMILGGGIGAIALVIGILMHFDGPGQRLRHDLVANLSDLASAPAVEVGVLEGRVMAGTRTLRAEFVAYPLASDTFHPLIRVACSVTAIQLRHPTAPVTPCLSDRKLLAPSPASLREIMNPHPRRSVPALAVTFLALAFTAHALRADHPTAEDLAGSTWELVALKSGDSTTWENAPAGERKFKMLTATHFVWVAYDANSGKLNGTGGGTYTLEGGNYIEFVEFGNGDVSSLRGKENVFTLDLRGDRLEQNGQLASGFKISEVWQRVR